MFNTEIDHFGSKHAREKSIRTMKINAAVCLGIGLIIASTFMMCYWNLFSHANSYNRMIKDMNDPTLDNLEYDRCLYISEA